ncbi:MAG: PEP-CTERM sorting domain-containing protein [Sedimenticola sp.]
MLKNKNVVLFFALMFFSTISSSALVSVNDAIHGVDSATYDERTGLTWLDLTATKGVSYDAVLANMSIGGAYEGWRYATVDEVTSLWDSAGGNGVYEDPSDGGAIAQYSGITETLIWLIGYTRAQQHVGFYGSYFEYWMYGLTGEVVSGTSSLRVAELYGNTRQHVDVTRLDLSYDPSFFGEFNGASWLVKGGNIPEPSTISLIVLGFIGILFLRNETSSCSC